MYVSGVSRLHLGQKHPPDARLIRSAARRLLEAPEPPSLRLQPAVHQLLEQLTERIQEAVRLGGAMIELPGLPPTSVLISPATPVFIERLATNEDSVFYPAVDDFPEAPDYNGF